MEYSSNMELEEGDLMEDAAAAASPGASGMKNSLQNSHICKMLLDSSSVLGSDVKLRVLQAFLFLEMLHHVVHTDYCSVAEMFHWFNRERGRNFLNVLV